MITIFGVPVFGVILPFIGRRTIPLNGDGSVVDTGQYDMTEETGAYYTRPMVFEWLGFGCGLGPALVYSARTNEPVDPPWLAVEGA